MEIWTISVDPVTLAERVDVQHPPIGDLMKQGSVSVGPSFSHRQD